MKAGKRQTQRTWLVTCCWVLSIIIIGTLPACSFKDQVSGEYYLNTQKYQDGIYAFEDKLYAQPDNASLNYYLGRFYLAEDQPQKALPCLKEAVQSDPDQASYHYWLGVAYGVTGQPLLERHSYQKALAIQPNHYQALTYLGHNQLEKQELSAALASYTSALAIRPDIQQALFNRALILGKLGRTPEEQEAWKIYLAYYPAGAKALQAAAKLNTLGDFDYRIHQVGGRKLVMAQIDFQPLSSALAKNSLRQLDYLAELYSQLPAYRLHVVSYQLKNRDLAKNKAQTIKHHMIKRFSHINAANIKLSWFDVPETVQVGRRKHLLNQSINFFTVKR